MLEFQRKQAFDFLKRNSYTNVCLKFLYDTTSYSLITLPLIFQFLVKNFSKIIAGWMNSMENLVFFFQS